MAHYSLDQPPKPAKRRRGWFLLFAVAVILGVGGAAFALLHHHQDVPTTKPAKTAAVPDLTSRLLVVGDVFWGRQVQKRAEASGKGYEYPTSGLDAADRAQYDAWIANFECPITYRDVAYSSQVNNLQFNCRPEYLPNLAKWFNAVTLANNHMDNNGGVQGLTETRQDLQKAGIQYTGNYDMTQTNDICEIVSLPAKIAGSGAKTTLPVALCGFMYVVNVTPTDAQLAVMRQYAKVMPVIALPHMGVEYRTTAEPEKVSAYHRMIDNGADVVIGAHPHVIQNSESYKGKLIAYSMGNFLFDQQSLGRDTTLGLGVELNLTIAGGAASQAYQRMASSCAAYKDNCLQQLQKTIKKRPAITVDYGFRCFDISSNVPVAGDKTTCDLARSRATVDKLSTLAKQW